MKRSLLILSLTLAVGLGLCPWSLSAAPSNDIVTVQYYAAGIEFRPLIEHNGMTLTVTGGRCFTFEDHFDANKGGILDARSFADGTYRWEVRALPAISGSLLEQIADARAHDDTQFVCDLQDEGILPPRAQVQSGYLRVYKGAVLDPSVQEDRLTGDETELEADVEGLSPAANASRQISTEPTLTNLSAADFVINDDLIVDGSACIGFDCVNGESFGFDTIRIKENNLRIKFDDTSTAASFPRNDWQLTANDSANGGASKFSIDDVTGGRTPFTVEAGAPSHSLYVDDGGRIGSGTSTPSVEIHTIDGDTPTLRLQQDGSSGFQP
ncbi:MAG: hypothetical protein KDD11_15850, partial [Acidobacteria bacterium]|nr:hypothetical protein [Acidobacteriota bacterium]